MRRKAEERRGGGSPAKTVRVWRRGFAETWSQSQIIFCARRRDPAMLVASLRTHERAAIEEHLRRKQTDPLTNVRVESGDVATNMAVRAGELAR